MLPHHRLVAVVLLVFGRLRSDLSGATAIEYGLIVTLIGLALIFGLNQIGEMLGSVLNKVGSTLSEYS